MTTLPCHSVEETGRTVFPRFKRGGDSILFDDMLPGWNAVGVSPDDSVRVLDHVVILGVFRTNHNIVSLKRGRDRLASHVIMSSSSIYLSIDLDNDPMEGDAMWKDLRGRLSST